MPIRPGDNWIICDLSGQRLYMSEAVKTWDGLLVHPRWWYPRHPQLDVRGVPDNGAVPDGRPQQPAEYIYPSFGKGDIILGSPDGNAWQVKVSDLGVVSVAVGVWQSDYQEYFLSGYELTVNNTGTLTLTVSEYLGPTNWLMVSPDGTVWDLTVTGGSITTTKAV